MEWRTVAFIVLVVSLCFLAIPIRVDPDTSNEDIKLFQNYVTRYNRSYRNDPSEYEERFKRFQVSRRKKWIVKINNSHDAHLYRTSHFRKFPAFFFASSHVFFF